MSLFRPRRVVERGAVPPFIGSFDDWVRVQAGGSKVSSSSAGTVDVGLQHSVIYRATNKVAATVASLPIDVRRGRVEVSPVPPLVASPSAMMLPSVWKHAAVLSMMLRGNAFGLVTAWAGAWPTKIELLHPDAVSWSTEGGWTVDGDPSDTWPVGPLWHVPLHVLPGSPLGLNPLAYARRTTFAALASGEFGSGFFSGGGHPSAIIAPERDPGEEGAKALKQRVMDVTSGTSREPIVLPQSVKYESIQINPDDSQFIELMRFSGEELCRFFGVDPVDVGVAVQGSALNYSNRENRQQDYLANAVLTPIVRLEEALTALLPRPMNAKFNVDGILRPDLKTRYESYRIAAEINKSSGDTFLSVDEMRALEDREPWKGDT